MRDSAYTLAYAAVLALLCASLLTAVGKLTADRREMNAEAEKARNVLEILQIPHDERASNEELLVFLKQSARTQTPQGGPTFHVYEHPGHGRLLAVEFSGWGLWGPIRGLLCLKRDMKTIHAVLFYYHQETPGIGGKIAEDDFQNRFGGKVIDFGGRGIDIVRGKAREAHEVDTISGATMTCEKVEAMLDRLVERIANARNQRDGG